MMIQLGSPIRGFDDDALIASLICALISIYLLITHNPGNDVTIILAHFLLSFGALGRFQTSV